MKKMQINKEQWNLASIYTSIDDPKIDADLKQKCNAKSGECRNQGELVVGKGQGGAHQHRANSRR